jgi:hypothetical protein
MSTSVLFSASEHRISELLSHFFSRFFKRELTQPRCRIVQTDVVHGLLQALRGESRPVRLATPGSSSAAHWSFAWLGSRHERFKSATRDAHKRLLRVFHDFCPLGRFERSQWLGMCTSKRATCGRDGGRHRAFQPWQQKRLHTESLRSCHNPMYHVVLISA